MLGHFYEQFTDTLIQLGIGRGDIVYVSSDLKRLLFLLAAEYGITAADRRNEVLNRLVQCIQQVTGKEGTILFPVFSWSFCRKEGFDYVHTKGETGTFSNWVMLNRKDFVRTRHPMYSFMVWGKDAELLKAMDNQDAWGICSPFQYLHENHAKQVLFDIEAYQGLTFGHYVEQAVKVPYRYSKYFSGRYVDEKGRAEVRVYSMYVRKAGVDVSCGVRNEFLIRYGAAVQKEWQKSVITVADLAACFPLLWDDMVNQNGRNTLVFRNHDDRL